MCHYYYYVEVFTLLPPCDGRVDRPRAVYSHNTFSLNLRLITEGKASFLLVVHGKSCEVEAA